MSNSAPQVDWGKVQRIAEKAAGAVERKLDRRIGKVENEVRQLRKEMSEIASAIRSMNNALGSKLDKLHTRTQEQVKISGQNASTNGKILAANAAGFTANVAANNEIRKSTDEVNSSVGRNTSALVEMEYLRLYNEARAPMRFVDQFSNEIENRFEKAVESVYLNRELYDEHFGRIFDENENKVRTIGEHIFQVLEEDFIPTVEQRLKIPRSAYQQLAMAVDAKRVQERSRQLDADLAKLYEDTLVPLLDMHHEFEMELAAEYAVEAKVSNEDILVPAGLTIDAGGDANVVVGTRVEGAPDRSDGLNYRLVNDDRYDELRTVLQTAESDMASHVKPRDLSDEDEALLMSTLERLASEGRIDADLLPGYRDYLQNFGLRSLSSGDAVKLTIEPIIEEEPEPELDELVFDGDDDGPPPLGDDGPPPLMASGDDDGPPPLGDDGPPPLGGDDGPPPLGGGDDGPPPLSA